MTSNANEAGEPGPGPQTPREGAPTLETGILHVFVAFDWGEEVDLEKARTLVPAEVHDLPRRRRTPSSIGYRPPPLRFALSPLPIDLPGLRPGSLTAEAIVFDFAAVSVGLHLPFRLEADALGQIAGQLADPKPWLAVARQAVAPLHQKILPAILGPYWQDDLSEEYFVFQLDPDHGGSGMEVLADRLPWLARLVRLEIDPLSPEEETEATRLHLSYAPHDLFLPDWAAAVLRDKDCEETLQTIEFANLQLLEYRHIDNRLDASLASAPGLIHKAALARIPFWRPSYPHLHALGELKVEANSLFERTGNVLKLLGDQYLARVYRLLASRFHLREWERTIQRKLEVAEGVYQVIANQVVTQRTEFLEMIIIFLIVLEILLAIFYHHG